MPYPPATLPICPPCPETPGGTTDVLFYIQQVTALLATLKITKSKSMALKKLDIIIGDLKTIIAEEPE